MHIKKIVLTLTGLSFGSLLLLFFGFLYFHIVVEAITIVIALYAFTSSVRSKDTVAEGFFRIVGSSYFAVAVLDLFHVMSYKGMNILISTSADPPTVFWVTARGVEAAGLLAALLFAARKPSAAKLFAVSLVVSAGLSALVFAGWMPVMYDDAAGLTTTKIMSEYFIIALFLVSMALLHYRRHEFTFAQSVLILAVLGITCISEFSFTMYQDVYGVMNIIGHIFKALSFIPLFLLFFISGRQNGETT